MPFDELAGVFLHEEISKLTSWKDLTKFCG
jgi:hypothetical protein